MTENKTSEIEFHSPIDLLRYTASEFNRLDTEAHNALHVEKDATKVQSKLTERAQLLVDLPTKMTNLVAENGFEFDEQNMTQLQQFAHMAEDRISEGDYFGLSTLLISKGDKIEDPNALEKLIENLDKV